MVPAGESAASSTRRRSAQCHPALAPPKYPALMVRILGSLDNERLRGSRATRLTSRPSDQHSQVETEHPVCRHHKARQNYVQLEH
jgi:hypothetical protein